MKLSHLITYLAKCYIAYGDSYAMISALDPDRDVRPGPGCDVREFKIAYPITSIEVLLLGSGYSSIKLSNERSHDDYVKDFGGKADRMDFVDVVAGNFKHDEHGSLWCLVAVVLSCAVMRARDIFDAANL